MSENLEAVQRSAAERDESRGRWGRRRRPTAKSARKHKEREATSRGDMGTGERRRTGTTELRKPVSAESKGNGERGTV